MTKQIWVFYSIHGPEQATELAVAAPAGTEARHYAESFFQKGSSDRYFGFPRGSKVAGARQLAGLSELATQHGFNDDDIEQIERDAARFRTFKIGTWRISRSTKFYPPFTPENITRA